MRDVAADLDPYAFHVTEEVTAGHLLLAREAGGPLWRLLSLARREAGPDRARELRAELRAAGYEPPVGGYFGFGWMEQAFAAYVETLVWTGRVWTEGSDGNGESLDEYIDASDLQVVMGDAWPEFRRSVRADLLDFLASAIEAGIEPSTLDPEWVGSNLALSRNGHGAGFFDTDHRDADLLQRLARYQGGHELDGWFDDDGTVVVQAR